MKRSQEHGTPAAGVAHKSPGRTCHQQAFIFRVSQRAAKFEASSATARSSVGGTLPRSQAISRAGRLRRSSTPTYCRSQPDARGGNKRSCSPAVRSRKISAYPIAVVSD